MPRLRRGQRRAHVLERLRPLRETVPDRHGCATERSNDAQARAMSAAAIGRRRMCGQISEPGGEEVVSRRRRCFARQVIRRTVSFMNGCQSLVLVRPPPRGAESNEISVFCHENLSLSEGIAERYPESLHILCSIRNLRLCRGSDLQLRAEWIHVGRSVRGWGDAHVSERMCSSTSLRWLLTWPSIDVRKGGLWLGLFRPILPSSGLCRLLQKYQPLFPTLRTRSPNTDLSILCR
jgi:hypothetical protein